MISIAKNNFRYPITKKISNRISGIFNLISNKMLLFPNPSNTYFTVDYSLRNVFNTGKLMVMDVNGKMVYQAEINYDRDQVLVPVEGWTAGQYTCVLLADGKTMLSKKITIVK